MKILVVAISLFVAFGAGVRVALGQAAAEGGCEARASRSASARPILGRLFEGTYRISNRFDHDRPYQFVDGNGFQVDSCGRVRRHELDGHAGIDFIMPEGTPILSPAQGTVLVVGQQPAFYCPYLGYVVRDQLSIIVFHDMADGRRLWMHFKHLSRIDVRAGQTVADGEQIGLSGNTGCSTGPHLHFETLIGDLAISNMPVVVDPFGWSADYPDPWAESPEGAASVWLWEEGAAPWLGDGSSAERP